MVKKQISSCSCGDGDCQTCFPRAKVEVLPPKVLISEIQWRTCVESLAECLELRMAGKSSPLEAVILHAAKKLVSVGGQY